MGKVSEVIRRKLSAGLQPTQLDILDESDRHAGHAGARAGGESHFAVTVESVRFVGLGRVARQRLVMGLLAGLGLGFLAALGLEQTNSTLGTIREFQAFVDVPVLAALPNLDLESSAPRLDSTVPLVAPAGGTPMLLSSASLRKNRIIALTDPESVAAEQYRLLGMKIRRQLQLKGTTSAPALLVTGFVGGEGKTVTALNLSLSLASTISGRVLLIDCDLRKPRVQEYLGMPKGKGFSDLLRSPGEESSDYLWKLNELYIMQGGSSLANPVALLSSKNASAVVFADSFSARLKPHNQERKSLITG